MNAATATLSNSQANAISALISGAMRDATVAGSRQAELVIAMFKNEVVYSADEILNIFRKTGGDKTDLIDTMLCAVSDEYAGIIETLAELKAKGKAKNKTDVFTVDSLNRKVRAARIMYDRALRSVYWLRIVGCRGAVMNKIGTGALKCKMPDKDSEGEYINEVHSGNHIFAQGDKELRAKLGKAKPEAKAKNPAANVLADASKSLAAVLTGLNAKTIKPIDDLNDEQQANAEVIFTQLFRMKFADDKGKIDVKDVTAFINELNNPKSAPAATKEAKAA